MRMGGWIPKFTLGAKGVFHRGDLREDKLQEFGEVAALGPEGRNDPVEKRAWQGTNVGEGWDDLEVCLCGRGQVTGS